MPIGTHLVLHDHADTEAILVDGKRLGEVVAAAAVRFDTPLALPLMDLTLEKTALLAACGVEEVAGESYHFSEPPAAGADVVLTTRMRATCEAIGYIARETALLPMGMCIGPFSLMTKLVSDPITPVYLSGSGVRAEEDPEVRLVEHMLELAERAVMRYVDAQAAAGAKALIVCEPAANKVYFSPNQLARSYAGFDRFVMAPNQRLRERLDAHGMDLFFHNCGELVDGMVSRFGTLDPAVLSLGSSRALWDDAALVPKSTVLYGNLPTKRFYSDALGVEEVQRLAAELFERMRAVGHPFILGSECDVLSVPGHEHAILGKVDAFMRCRAAPDAVEV